LEATVHGSGLFEENGGSTAEDVVSYCQWTLFDLSYTEAVAVVTTTEAATISAGHLAEGTLKACQNRIFFSLLNLKAMKRLLGKQVEGRAVKPIQDVFTRWWRAYTMCEFLRYT
jgi:hypothetical protein